MNNTKGEKSPESKRQESLRSRRKAAGLVRLDEWVTPELKKKIKEMIKQVDTNKRCVELGLNPDNNITSYNDMMKFIENSQVVE
jgi:hypothetical protein